ncbi:hypothetical protein V6U90_28430 [Micromonospora sp. CPCC 206060]|uniref:hypothetical protein n=1 Tax=Micromonospora sp. CPCC 206060 TaxID=3122406 RepID=UPI002FEF0A10
MTLRPGLSGHDPKSARHIADLLSGAVPADLVDGYVKLSLHGDCAESEAVDLLGSAARLAGLIEQGPPTGPSTATRNH